jgi:hypothetical protein
MKYLLLLILILPSTSFASNCKVKICNKLERFTLSPTNWIADKWGENCMEVILPKEEAKEGKVLSKESRWYQGSLNPTKKSVTRVAKVISCE